MEAEQFDVYRLSDGTLVVVLQNDVVDNLRSRVAAPMILREGAGKRTTFLNPMIEISGTDYLLKTELLAAVPVAELGTRVTSVPHARDAITRAIDLLFTGV